MRAIAFTVLLAACAAGPAATVPSTGTRPALVVAAASATGDYRPPVGALNPAVTQATIRTTICVSGWTATIRPPVSYTAPLKLAQMRARLEEALTTHPVGIKLLDQQRERDPATVKNSGDQLRDGAADDDDDAGSSGAS